MRLTILIIFLQVTFTARSLIGKNYIQNFQKVLIETLPVNRVAVDEGSTLFSFELPKGFQELNDSIAARAFAEKFGLHHDCFLGSFLDERSFIHKDGQRLVQSYWAFNMCGHDTYPSQYPENFCAERITDHPDNFREMLLDATTSGKLFFSNSLIDVPFLHNPLAKLPHYEYRQCYRYSQSLLITFVKIDTSSKSRMVHAKITTIIPTPRDYTTHYFEYWSTKFHPIDILRLKRLMNSIQYSPTDNVSSCSYTPIIQVFQPINSYHQFIDRVFRRVFSIR